MAQVTVENISVGYEKKAVVNGLSFKVEKGDYLCIIGENGAGKTTLFKTLIGLQRPLEGTISFGEELARRRLGYLPQQRDVQKDFPASVTEVVLSGCLNKSGLRPFYNKSEKTLAFESMKKLGIADMAKKCFRELSGGQQQRVLLARALCATSTIIFLDEPAAGLDPDAESAMYELINELNRGGVTVVMISHDIQKALKCSSHILHLQKKSYFFGTTEEYKKKVGGAGVKTAVAAGGE